MIQIYGVYREAGFLQSQSLVAAGLVHIIGRLAALLRFTNSSGGVDSHRTARCPSPAGLTDLSSPHPPLDSLLWNRQ